MVMFKRSLLLLIKYLDHFETALFIGRRFKNVKNQEINFKSPSLLKQQLKNLYSEQQLLRLKKKQNCHFDHVTVTAEPVTRNSEISVKWCHSTMKFNCSAVDIFLPFWSEKKQNAFSHLDCTSNSPIFISVVLMHVLVIFSMHVSCQ